MACLVTDIQDFSSQQFRVRYLLPQYNTLFHHSLTYLSKDGLHHSSKSTWCLDLNCPAHPSDQKWNVSTAGLIFLYKGAQFAVICECNKV